MDTAKPAFQHEKLYPSYRIRKYSLANIRLKLPRYFHLTRTLLAAPRRYEMGPLATVRQLLKVRRDYRFRWGELLHYGYMDPSLSKETLDGIVNIRDLMKLQKRIDPGPVRPLFDKLMFYSLCSKNGLPIPELFGVYTTEQRDTDVCPIISDESSWRDFWANTPATDVILKPVYGEHGFGVTPASRSDERFRISNGRTFDVDGMRRYLLAQGYDHWLIQQRAYSHDDIKMLSGTDALQTARLVTYLDDDTPGTVIAAWIRLIVGSEIIDNFGSGGIGNIMATVDSETGKLIETMGRTPRGYRNEIVTEHPVTGAPLTNFHAPMWSETIHVALSAARVFQPLKAVAWDIGITNDGPVIIEGGLRWGGASLAHDPVIREANAFLKERARALGV